MASPDLNLSAYFERIEYQASSPRANLETLQALHLAHASHIPFENLDIQLGLPISLDLPMLEDKLVRRQRGGYCFEHNTLFLAVLRQLEFDAIACEARVRLNTKDVTPRTHMLLLVRLPEGAFLADVGFGGEGLLWALPIDGSEQHAFQQTRRVVAEGNLLVLQVLQPEGWADMYAFAPEARYPVDFEMANHFTSTHPKSRFVTMLTAQLPTPGVRHVLRNRSYVQTEGSQSRVRELDDPELRSVLREIFGLDVPDNARFRALHGR